ncbi:RING-H2 finger protein ATL39-like [Andrographis paniculata]|uniref:RING-H2 finger protein ATL39-like n=1 Tax=Andrographis paniculata TaxID=175694 RepID=UPI0021E8C2AE|nr:RING-H2 finger protein ATL39-like [Andrographis paniculata]
MMSSGINLVMTVIGFSVSILFIVFVCTRLICARIIRFNASRGSLFRLHTSDPTALERGRHGVDPLVVANFPTKRYRELCFPVEENAQCTVCLSEYHDEDALRILPFCGHFFHPSCIDAWLQQHFTCPVCRISLREVPERKWFMQPMFSSAIRSQFCIDSINVHYSRCAENSHRHLSVSHRAMDPPGRDGNFIPAVNHDPMAKDLENQKVESSSA